MQELLINAGLTKLQAQTYLYLLKNGPTLPSELNVKHTISRTNTYKVLESLEKLGLVTRKTKDKKVIYIAEDPIALTSLVAEKRNSVIALEKNISKAMQQLRKSYVRSRNGTKIHTSAGKEAIAKEYSKQAELKQPIYFLKTRADVPFMGFEVMNAIRVAQGKLSPNRYGITHDSTESPNEAGIDKKTNLTRTWVDEKDYTAPVEWSVSGDNLLIQVFDADGQTVTIQDGLIAESFRQIWLLLNKSLRDSNVYPLLPIHAKRKI
jgi:DNA-binding MarR family transcriptional regulator